jgi:hypothetical protein
MISISPRLAGVSTPAERGANGDEFDLQSDPMEEQLNSDPFMQLLTDALRAGPGSPEWHQAVARVNAGETAAGEKGPNDEYALLVRARENLASGKAYREVRAGVGFTRKLMQSVVAESDKAKKNPFSASWIAYIGAGLAVASLAVLIAWLTQTGTGGEDLTNLFFGTTKMAASLESPTLPHDWKTIGPLAMDPKGLAPIPPIKPGDYRGGGIVSKDGIPANEPFALEAEFDFQHVSDDVVPQLFVTDDPSFSDDRGVSPHELVWLVRGGEQHVALPDLQLTSASRKVQDNQSIRVRIIVGASTAIVLCDGNELWSGQSQLGNKPRYVGVRLLCKKDDKRSVVSVKQLRVMTK